MPVLILNRKEIERLLSMQTCIGLMEAALASLARGEVILPLRPVLRIPDTQNLLALMPAYSESLRALGTKLITVYPGNHGTSVDSHQGVVLLFDGATGSLQAILDATSITAIRTAAVSAVATNLLARQDATVVTILGSGVQGASHIDAMLATRPFTQIHVWSRSLDHARALAARVRARHSVSVDATTDLEGAVRRSHVVCTVTASRVPVLRGDWLRPGTHVNAVGASIPSARELDTSAVLRSRLFVDRRESALNEAGDVLIPMQEGAFSSDHVVAEIGELLTGDAAGREHDTDITLFKSLGLAVEDLACAHFLHAKAKRDGAGTWIDL